VPRMAPIGEEARGEMWEGLMHLRSTILKFMSLSLLFGAITSFTELKVWTELALARRKKQNALQLQCVCVLSSDRSPHLLVVAEQNIHSSQNINTSSH